MLCKYVLDHMNFTFVCLEQHPLKKYEVSLDLQRKEAD